MEKRREEKESGGHKDLMRYLFTLILFFSVMSYCYGKEKYTEVTCEITAYCYGSITAIGTRPRIGTVAVDPKFIPYGTKLFIPGYGWAIAEDCGGSITGWMIDIFLPSPEECYIWGRRNLKVKILMKNNE